MRAIIAVSLLLLLVGCVGERGPQSLYVNEDAGSRSVVGQEAADTDGDGEPDIEPFTLNVTVLDVDTGAPIAGAGVMFRIFDCDWCSDPAQQVGLRTDAEGVASLEIYAERQMHVVAGFDGFTTEDAPRLASRLGESKQITIPLYHTRHALQFDDAYGLAVRETVSASTGVLYGEAERTRAWAFHNDSQIQAGYMARLTDVAFNITWTNAPDGSGHLYGILGPAGAPGIFVQTPGPAFPAPVYGRTMGPQQGEASWDAEAAAKDSPLPAQLRVGAALGTSTITTEGVPFKMHYEATFEGDEQYVVRVT